MGLSKYEQEITINFNAADNTATLYSSDPVWIRKMDKLVEQNPEQFKVYRQEKANGKVIAKAYTFPKTFISIRSKKITRNLTEEQKKQLSDRMKQLRINSIQK